MRRGTRPVFVALIAALAAVVLAAGALAGARDKQHPALPARLVGVPELSAVVWDGQSNAFIQFMFDRGKITSIGAASSGNTLTIQQGSAGHVWRAQSFTIPTTATIRLNHQATAANTTAGPGSPDSWRTVPFARLKSGMHVRIVQTGPVGGSLQIVRVDATRADRDVPLPTSAG